MTDTTFARWREHARQAYAQECPVETRTIIREDGIVTEVIEEHAARRGVVMPFTTLDSWVKRIQETERERIQIINGLSDEEFDGLMELAAQADVTKGDLLAMIEERVCPPDDSHPCQGGIDLSNAELFRAIHRATSDPGALVKRERYEKDGEMIYESLSHWQARAVIVAACEHKTLCKSCVQYEFVQMLKERVF